MLFEVVNIVLVRVRPGLAELEPEHVECLQQVLQFAHLVFLQLSHSLVHIFIVENALQCRVTKEFGLNIHVARVSNILQPDPTRKELRNLLFQLLKVPIPGDYTLAVILVGCAIHGDLNRS